MEELSFLPKEEYTDRWDQEWLMYLQRSYAPRYFESFRNSRQVAERALKAKPQLKSASPGAIFHHRPVEGHDRLALHLPGEHLIDQKVVEIGCGTGYCGKFLGYYCVKYLGIDHSSLALHIARLVSPPNCEYVHSADRHMLERHRGNWDSAFGRYFFIHQNFESAVWVLKLLSYLLKSGGLISADFYNANPSKKQGVVHHSWMELDPNLPSCTFQYDIADIETLAVAVGLQIKSLKEDPDMQRRFVIFRRP